jgi:hypothetical protein
VKKLLTQFYLWVSILLLTGANSNAFASTNAAPINNSIENELKSDSKVVGFAKFISYSRFHFEKQTDTVLSLETENEEETHEFSLHKLLGEKKSSAIEYACLSIYFNPEQEIAKDTFTEFCPSGNYFHSLSSRQYILYEVFRI